MNHPHIYAVIIGTEILNRRRSDKHFEKLSTALAEKGFSLFASFVIKDDAELISNIYNIVKNDPEAIMFSFGGIGSTPDDLTRQLAANTFSDGKLYRHAKFEQDILDRLGEERAYPHPIKMSDLPKDAGLLFNPVNNMSGFYLQDRYFFMPGFPEMAHPMIDNIVAEFLPEAVTLFSKGFIAECGEGRLTQFMVDLPDGLELSSLPMINSGSPRVELTLTGKDQAQVEEALKTFTTYLDKESIEYNYL